MEVKQGENIKKQGHAHKAKAIYREKGA